MAIGVFFLAICVFLASLPTEVSTHGAMVIPYNWFDHPQWIKTKDGYEYDFIGMKTKLQCVAGSEIPNELVCPKPEHCAGLRKGSHWGNSCMWFSNYTFVDKPTVFDPKLRTYQHTSVEKKILHNPWRAPGYASLFSPCGAAGGNPKGCLGGPDCGNFAGGYQDGPVAETFDFQHEIHVTNWTRGDVVEVVWGISANHGGGYSYRLCKMPKEGRKGLTEECFQQRPLKFVGDKLWIQYGEDKSTRIEVPAVRTDKGTFPLGSQWTKNPIPACNGRNGGVLTTTPCPNGTQFPAVAPDLQGYGFYIHEPGRHFPFTIIDLVQIPKDLEEGEYVISFRWDCEQSPQVWNTCANVRLL
eukprot:TCONS_00031897-protein